MITLVACPKPFTDSHIATIQRNAIKSWTLLVPRPDIIVFGDELGIAEACTALGVRHVPEVQRNEYGTPLLHDIFLKATELAKYKVMCYVNSDIILMSDFARAVQGVMGEQPFLMSGGRSGLDVSEGLEFVSPDWEDKLCQQVRARRQFSFYGNDYFIFSRGLYSSVPPLAIGRAGFDAWLISAAKARGARIIDASAAITAVHQNHDYRHTTTKDVRGVWTGPEADHNVKFIGRGRQWFLLEASHVLTGTGLRRVWARKLRAQVQEFLVYRTGSVRKALGLNRAGLRRLASMFRFESLR